MKWGDDMPKKTCFDNKLKILEENGSLNKNADKVKDPLFQNNSFFDAKDIVQVKYEMLRAVEKDRQSIIQTSETFGFSRVSYYKILNSFKKYGIEGMLPRKRGPKKAHKLTPEVMDFINEKTTQNPNMSKKDLVNILETDKGIKIHKRTIEKNLSSGKKKR